jgi:pimeloyl-[acyl-carrier protein] synthase
MPALRPEVNEMLEVGDTGPHIDADTDIDAALVSADFVRDPYPLLDLLRERDAVYWSDSLGAWVLTRYHDIVTTFKDAATFSNEGRLARAAAYLPEPRSELAEFDAHYKTKGLLHSDPPDHTRMRRVVSRALAPRAVDRMRPRIQQIVDQLIDKVEPRGHMDVIEDLAFALPAIVLADLMGVPVEQGQVFRAWADRLLGFQGVNRPGKPLLVAAQEALVEARAYLAGLIELRRREPAEDLISLMSSQSDGGGTMTDAEIINTGMTLLTAGHETTTSLIGNGLLTLLQHRDQWNELRADRSLVGSAIEEILRFESPVSRQPRLLRQDTTLSSRVLPKGDMVFQMLGAANRDSQVFADPATFDIHRDPNRHLAFGLGIHFCIGAPLARAEGEIVLQSVLERLPRMRLVERVPDWDTAKANSRVLRSLPVTF